MGGGFRHSDELPEPPAVAPTVTKQTAPVTAAARQSHPNSVTASQVNPDRTAAKQVASDGAIVVPIEPDGMATEQGFYALTAYALFCRNAPRLFDLTSLLP